MDEDFHIHIYFDSRTRDSALAIREQLAAGGDGFEVELQPVREAPLGPHPTPMFNAHTDRANLGRVIHWLMRNHGPHAVLIHPNTGDDLRDHTRHAMWIGGPLDLVLSNL